MLIISNLSNFQYITTKGFYPTLGECVLGLQSGISKSKTPLEVTTKTGLKDETDDQVRRNIDDI